ncbi:MAG: glycosyltransferase family 2 protein [Butyricicoccaceae bacterium]
MSNKLLTVTVPCYNSEAYLHKCIDSLLPGGDCLEIIIINDGSSDRTGEIADAYVAKYPDIVRVVHQENGGHGEGINQGLRNASGTYFKVVDSDDWVDLASLHAVINFLKANTVDLLVTNYVYEHENPKDNSTIRYANVFPNGKVIGWEQTRHFLTSQYLTLHSCIFRTEILRKSGMVLPKHTFYEDNLFVYTPLPLVKRLAYLNVDFYRYLIGREGQSVNEAIMTKRCDHQIRVSEAIFAAHDLSIIQRTNPKLAKYMYHEATFMMIIATVFTRLNRTPETERMNREMWENAFRINPKMASKMRYRSKALFLNFPGKLGNQICCGLYRAAHSIVQFN